MRVLRVPAVTAAMMLLVMAALNAQAVAPGNAAFQRTWERTDQPVASGAVARTWIWGPEASTPVQNEPYTESPGGSRRVQYYDKSRMEINDPSADPASPFFVTNGLLVVELMSGRLQLGADQFAQHSPAQVNVAGDPDDPLTYADLAPLRSAPAAADGAALTQRVDGNGQVSDDPTLASQGVTAAQRVQVPGLDHQVASPFWEFLNSTGPVLLNGQIEDERLFEPWFYATGLPITEAYWAEVKVGGTVRLVLLQCFERRCLTYTPGNPAGFLVEAGNVGQHYHVWRYELIPNEGTPTATVTATSTTTSTPTATEAPAPEYQYVAEWGKPFIPIEPLVNPEGVAVDDNNNLWVVDSATNRLLLLDENGVYKKNLERNYGSNPGQYIGPVDVAFADDQFYVVDRGNNRIQVFDMDGLYLFSWGSFGSGSGQFDSPSAIEISNGIVYVCDTGNDRVQTFNLSGMYNGYFGGHGSGDGFLDSPRGLAALPDETVYVADTGNNRVEIFRLHGYAGQFGGTGAGAGQFDEPGDVAIGATGEIYVADTNNGRIQKFDSNHAYLTEWRAFGYGAFDEELDLALDHEGNVYASDSDYSRIQKFTGDGVFLYELFDNRRGTFSVPTGIAVDQNGDLLTVDGHDDTPTISRYTPTGTPLDSLARGRTGAGPHDVLLGVAVGKTGDIYVTERVANRVQRFSSTWAYLGEWGSFGTGPGQFSGPTAIAIDADGAVYVADSGNNRVQKFDANGVFLAQWGGLGTGQGLFNNPQGIAIDGERVYVSDYNNNRIEVFRRTGEYVTEWGQVNDGVVALDRPLGVAVNPDGYVLVVDFGNSRVAVYTAIGEGVGSFGMSGSGPGQFNVPYAIAIDDSGAVYVTDVNNHRVQKFAPVN